MVQGDLNVTHAEYDRARACYGRSPRRFWQEGHLLATASTLEQFASLEAEAGADELAAGLTGAVDAFCDSRGIVLPLIWRAWWSAEPAGIRAHARAGEQPIAAAWAEGQLMPLADAVVLVPRRRAEAPDCPASVRVV
ncbi:MAG: hypothetical protein JO023_06185 [Chloroflexi bacterium]|nr:hypothetical protein [Chloroflexota bacterium]